MENREIEFRAWDDGFMVYFENVSMLKLVSETIKKLALFFAAIREDSILMEFTGLKDKNGKKIFEGDFLGGIYEGCYVGYCDKCCSHQVFLGDEEIGCMSCQGDIGWYELLDDADLEVIGNIFENPELLEQD